MRSAQVRSVSMIARLLRRLRRLLGRRSLARLLRTRVRPRLQEQGRVDHGAIQRDAPMQVRAGDTAGGADFTEQSAGLDAIPELHGQLAEMAVHGDQAMTVIHIQRVAVEEEIT